MDNIKEVEELQDKLTNLTSNEYDDDLFKLRRNYIIGTYMVDVNASKNLEWTAAYTTELYPQHWMYHLLLILKDKYPKKYAIVCETFSTSETKLYNESRKKKAITLYGDDLWKINMEVFNTLLVYQKQKLTLQTKLQIEKTKLKQDRVKKVIEVTQLIKIARDKVVEKV